MPYELIVKADFGAAHSLRQYKGKCERLHGHNWRLDICLAADGLNADDMVIDFVDAKAIIGDVLKRYDHYHLNDVPPFDKVNPTSENIARVIAEEIRRRLPEGVRLARLTAWEGDANGATYIP